MISNIIENGKAIGGLGDGEAFWHTDQSFVDVPPAASLLRSLECPPPSAGGATYFLNCTRPTRPCPADIKKRIDGMTMIHAATHSSGGKAHKGFETVEDVSKVPGARQPMVRTHPETGKKCAVPRPPHQRLCASACRSRRARRCSTTCGTHTTQDKFTWTPGLAGRRSRLVGQSLRDAPPRRLRPARRAG